MSYSSINIQGNIVSGEVLDKIRNEEDFRYQKATDFGLDKNIRLRELIGSSWAILRSQWQSFQLRRQRLKEDDSATTETRNYWIIPLLEELGYVPEKAIAETFADKSYAISHRATNLDGFPLHLVGFNDSLDKRRESGGPRLSPHALVQEYLNNTEHLYALVSNGRYLRLLRDATRLIRLSYIEFDLEKMMEEELYAEFAILFRLLHVSRMPQKIDEGETSFIEFYHQESLASGSRIREKLSKAVETSLKQLANGFLNHPMNSELTSQVSKAQISPQNYYLHLLRGIYRILFIMVTEERQLVYPKLDDAAVQAKRKIYYLYYSLNRLRKLAERMVYVDGSKHDLWESLKTTFLLFEEEKFGHLLGISPLGAGLFGADALGNLSSYKLNNEAMLNVIKNLTLFENENKQLVRVNYGDLDVEEFGSIYEGLLELEPVFKEINGQFTFTFVEGTGRSSSGSHYTPEELVRPLIKHSLDYIIEDKLKLANSESQVVSGDWQITGGLISTYLINFISNCIFYDEDIQGIGDLERGDADSRIGLSVDKTISERRIVWNDFAASPFSSFYSGQHSRGLGTKQQQRISLFFENSQRKSQGIGNPSAAFGNDRTLQSGTGKGNTGTLHTGGKDDSKLYPFHFSEKIIKQTLQKLPQTTRYSLLATCHLLSIKVADVACGSGHILLNAARRIGTELARVRTGEDQPTPLAMRQATRDVIKNCIYGVDKNPLAVELCKVALWLEAHNPGEPLNFLDHHIKCGDAIVGLAHREELETGIADEAFKTLPGDDKEIAQTFSKKNRQERKEREAKAIQLKADFEKTTANSVQEAMAKYKTFNQLPETTPIEIERKAQAYRKFMDGKGFTFLKALADTQVAQFFIPKTTENKDNLMTDAEFRLILSGYQGWQDRKTAKATVIANENRFFHWFLEFPEIFSPPAGGAGGGGGFDCILGNPPFLAGARISTHFGNYYLKYILSYFEKSGGQSDFVAYFFQRAFKLITPKGFYSLIATNSISQGDTRENALEYIISNNGNIIFAIKSTKWPGNASLEVSLVSIYKGLNFKNIYLNGKEVNFISSYLDDEGVVKNPFVLNGNQNLSFQGTYVMGKSFILTKKEAEEIINKDFKYSQVISSYLIGEDINSSPDQSPQRSIINFYDWNEERAKNYELTYNILLNTVKEERERNNRESRKKYWWRYGDRAVKLYESIKKYEFVFVVCRVTKFLCFTKVPSTYVYDIGTNTLIFNQFADFSKLQSSIHELWARKYGSSLETRLRYLNEDCFETFPFPQNLSKEQEIKLEQIGEHYHEHRRQLMLAMQLGLTKTYNAFHAKEVQLGITSAALQALDKKAIEKQYGKEIWNLWNHLQKTPNTCTIEEAIAGIVKLRQLHVEMDEAVLGAYCWSSSHSGEAGVRLRHDFYEVDYLPENDRVRYTIHPDARKEVLKRLLLLNHERYEEELKQGLHKREDAEKFYKEKGVEMPEEVKKHYLVQYKTAKGKVKKVEEDKEDYGQGKLEI
ncbi:MAG: DNA methyltransferase [Bacteroidales bacterium]